MTARPEIALVGPGRLGSALALALANAGYKIREIVAHNSNAAALRLSRAVRATPESVQSAKLDADLVWFCVPDREIAAVARKVASGKSWKGKIAFHSSGALASDELDFLRLRAATVASVHPFMTFVRGSTPPLNGVPFALEGDAKAVGIAGRIVRDLGGQSFTLDKRNKAAYHAWGGFASPLIIALLASAERVASLAGFSSVDARKKMLPIVRQTIANYAQLGAAAAFTGPLVRADAAVVSEHLRVLQQVPLAREVYLVLARAALKTIPVQDKNAIEKIIRPDSRR